MHGYVKELSKQSESFTESFTSQGGTGAPAERGPSLRSRGREEVRNLLGEGPRAGVKHS